jgi:DNA-binding CsgD family transcriptional regulator
MTAATHDGKQLSHREREILYWMSKGKTNPQIAEILGIARGTVRKHAGNIYMKLKVPNRMCAVFHAPESIRRKPAARRKPAPAQD